MNITKNILVDKGIKYWVTKKLNGKIIRTKELILDILYADDTLMITDSIEDLQSVMDVFNDIANQFGMILSHEKTEVMVMTIGNDVAKQIKIMIRDYTEERKKGDGVEVVRELKNVEKIKYLGHWIANELREVITSE